MMDLENLPMIDWDQALKLAGNKPELAEEMLQLVIRDIANELLTLKMLQKEQNHHEIIQKAHKLHGALCYTGLPRIKSIIKRLETDLKNNIMDSSPVLIDQLEFEYNQLLKQHPAAIAKSNSSNNA